MPGTGRRLSSAPRRRQRPTAPKGVASWHLSRYLGVSHSRTATSCDRPYLPSLWLVERCMGRTCALSCSQMSSSRRLVSRVGWSENRRTRSPPRRNSASSSLGRQRGGSQLEAALENRSRLASSVTLLALLLTQAACTNNSSGQSQLTRASTTAHPQMSTASDARSSLPTSVRSAGAEGPPQTTTFSSVHESAPLHAVTLSCAQGAAGLTLPEPADPSGVTIESLVSTMTLSAKGSDFRLTGTYATAPFRKAPIYVADRVHTVVLTVPPDGRQALGWVPLDVWTTQTPPPDLRRWITSTLTLKSCPAATVGYLGGIFAADPTRCFPLTTTIDGKSSTRPIRLSGDRC